MSDFINTVDIVDDDVLISSLIDRSFSGSFNDDKITKIGAAAFTGCKNLESVCFPNATAIGDSAFKNSGLKAITPEMFPLVTFLDFYDKSIFMGSVLETIDWPSIVTINSRIECFKDCKSLRSVNLPNLKNLGSNAVNSTFDGCILLTDVNLPVITSCPSFNNCTSLRVIDLPSCTTFKGNNLANCPLDALILRNTTMCQLNNIFNDSGIANGTGYIYVPSALIDSYKTATNWSTYASQFRSLEDYTVDGTTTGELDETKI